MSAKVPRRCRWWGHNFRSKVTGHRVDAVIGPMPWGLIVCDRCGVDWTDVR